MSILDARLDKAFPNERLAIVNVFSAEDGESGEKLLLGKLKENFFFLSDDGSKVFSIDGSRLKSLIY
ncbi:hypothetical protein GCM10010082_05830 [Kushneria pakistanensis]|uniref:Uncharacterized protein n=2 Tax=Kushneria pakistanensis TaxID=1508770 RepID=A0ABQ3FBY6_9GAMM|nr:hypothetical protein GCM10010082_05830 [Kushneria pakistanensis]